MSRRQHAVARSRPWRWVFFIPLVPACAAGPAEDIRLPSVFADRMVLQRDQPVTVWGWASPGGTVTVALGGGSIEVRVDRDSTWRAELPPMPAGGPHTLRVTGIDTVIVSDVLVGEVWVASGQSNMEWPLARTRDSVREANAADYPDIRFFRVEHDVSYRRERDVETDGWTAVTSQSVLGLSAVAYFFARKLHADLGVPIGILQTAWGGTPAEAWTSAEGLRALPDFAERLAAVEARAARGETPPGFQEALASWIDSAGALDPGRQGDVAWSDPELPVDDWGTHPVPGAWSGAGLDEFDGAVWFRTTVVLPAGWSDSDLTLSLARVDDVDSTWVNGEPVGGTLGFQVSRRYEVPARVWRDGPNTVAVRVIDTGGWGGLYGAGDSVYVARGADRISLAGDWRFRPAVELADLPPLPLPPQHHVTGLFNAMVAPLVPIAMRGVIWYQGEANASRAHQYRTLFPAMIRDWRRAWGRDFPFLYVQLANFLPPQRNPVEAETWPELREAQSFALELPRTAEVVTIDIGEADDIHPRNKQDVGLRLALAALGTVYGRDVVPSGPRFREMTVEGDKIRLHFDHVGSGLVAAGGDLRGFAVAGEDREFVWADAVIDGETVVVSAAGVSSPVAVRYAWANNPVISLYNREGLPASPFRTDDWPGVTDASR